MILRPTFRACLNRVSWMLAVPAFFIVSASSASADFAACPNCNVIVISVDTLRSDALGVYGNPRNPTPGIDAFANSAILFENAYSVIPRTASSHMTMFTGLIPEVHGVWNVTKSMKDRGSLVPTVKPLAEILHDDGYATIAYTGGANVAGPIGFARGFDTYSETPFQSIDQAAAFLGARKVHDKKFFLFLHTYHMHDPYLLDTPFDTMFDPKYSGKIIGSLPVFQKLIGDDWSNWYRKHDFFWDRVNENSAADQRHLRALYDGAARFLDVRMEPFLRNLKKFEDNTIVIFTADHGEEFHEHGEFVHNQVYSESIKVPLLLKYPGAGGGSHITQVVSLLGLSHTILDLLGLQPSDQFKSSPIWPTAPGSGTPGIAFAELPDAFLFSLVKGKLKIDVQADLDKGMAPGKCEFYDVSADPHEQNNLGCTRPDAKELLAQLRSERLKLRTIKENFPAVPATAPPVLPEKTIQQLRSLGYLN